MGTNDFIAKLKATASEKGSCDLAKYFEEYREIIKSLDAKERGAFSLNVFCVLIRNIETGPSWKDISIKNLLNFGIECVRHTRNLDKPELVKTLGCVFRLHRHVVNEKSPTPPELVLKLSFMPFEYDDRSLLNEYYKTYGHMIIDRLTYIAKLKSTKLPIQKLLQKLIEDLVKTIKIYDTVQFCTDMLILIIKKILYVFNEWPDEINDSFGKIFECIANSDLKGFKNISEKQAADLYVKFNECLCLVTENTLRVDFKNSVLDSVTRVCLSMLGHVPDIFHCFQTIFLNSFCHIFNDKTNPTLIDNLLRNILTSCEMTEKLGYTNTIYATYPFINQLLRLFIEYFVNKKKSDHINEETQRSCFNLASFLMKKLKKTKQLSKCENCSVKSGLHDALRLAFTVKHIIISSLESNIEIKSILPLYYNIVEQQYIILDELNTFKCSNRERCFKKLQIDIHNLAVMLNGHKHYEYSMKLFDIFLKYELRYLKSDAEFKNMSRTLYNKSICESDAKQYKKSLLNAYLSLVFSLPEGLNSEKYISLVIDIKSKALKSATEDSDEINEMQSMSILEACDLWYDDDTYGSLKMFLKNLDFCSLLKHEFSMYTKLWASAAPLAGVCAALLDLTARKHAWVKVVSREAAWWALHEAVLGTAGVVLSVHCARLRHVVLTLADKPHEGLSVGERIVHSAMLFLKAEYDTAEAAEKHAWKVTEHTTNPFQEPVRRTIYQEHGAIGAALRAAEMLAQAVPEFEPGMLSSAMLQRVLQIACLSMEHLLLLHWFAHAALLALAGCRLAQHAGDTESYVLFASVLIYHSDRCAQVDVIVASAVKCAAELLTSGRSLDAALCLLCDVAIYYTRGGRLSVAGQLVQTVQRRLLTACENQQDETLYLSMGRLLEAQAMLCPGSGLSMLSAVNGVQRHYLAAHNTGSGWTARRRVSLCIKRGIAGHGLRGARAARRLALCRRASCAAAAALPAAGAAARAALHASVVNTHDADAQSQLTLWVEAVILANEPITSVVRQESTDRKREHFSPEHGSVELMLESMHRNSQSPYLAPRTAPQFQTPEFMQHAGSCACHACVSPACTLIACQLHSLQASAYFRAKEFDTARSFFEGARETFRLAERKLKNIFSNYKNKKFNNLAVDIAKKMSDDELKTVQLEFLIELSFFELSQRVFEKADDCIVNIYEILSEFKNVDPYLRNEVSNLMVTYANLRKNRILKETGLELDMEELKLSPRMLKTPEPKPIPTLCNVIKVVSKDELPQKLKPKPLKFNEEDNDETADTTKDEVPKRKKKTDFKVPIPATSKPVLENFTPRPTLTIPKIKKTQPKEEAFSTPKTVPDLFSTPCQSTPAEFFTPMTSIKTYTKKRNIVNIAKNLETEFSTPKVKDTVAKLSRTESATGATEPGRRTRSKVETGTIKELSVKKATSPGKLVEEKVLRTRKPK